jgi:hypothetical protein
MASSFQPEDPILYFRLSPDPKAGKRTYLLWPAWAWRVVAPAVRERQLNVLQKAVLGLSQAGVVSAEAVSRKLGLELDLAAFIASELRQRGWTDSWGRLTDKGRELLEEETLQAQQMVTGFVFQDPWNQELWPRFVERLNYAEREVGKNGFPRLVMGTTGDPKPKSAFMHLPLGAVSPSQPDVRNILDVTRRHRQALRGAGRSPGVEDEDGGTFEPNPIDFDRVALVDERPQRVFLATYFYLPKDADQAGDWQVCDPFGMGSSTLLRRAMERQMEHSPELHARVEELLGSALREDIGGVRAWKERLQGKAELIMDRQLTPAIRQLPYHKDILELTLAYVEVEELGEGCSAPTLRAVLLAARRLLEALLAHLLGAHRPVDITRRLAREQEYCTSVYTSTAKELGFETPLPPSLANVKREHVHAVVKRAEAWRLRPLIIANLLAARDDSQHPLRKVARHEQRLLAELDIITAAASSEMHPGSRGIRVKDVQDTVHRVYRVVGLLSGLDDGSRNPPLR